ncbi:MAG: EAL domain-containing protein [Lachnospiraceae bacterium]|nr:EAL domain-containing protein [Lachnospiraceae bacterium]
MWSYSFEIPTLLVLLIILSFYFSRRRLSLKRNLLFIQMIAVETFVIVFDTAASIADNNYMLVPQWLVDTLNMLYFIGFFTRSFAMYRFTVSVTKTTYKVKSFIRQLIYAPFYLGLVFSIISPFTGFIFYVDEQGYHAGPFYSLVYWIGFFYIFIALIYVFCCRKNNQRRELFGIFYYNLVIFTGLIVRAYLPKTLLMDTFVLMAILIVYLAFENPEYYLDLKGSVFNSGSLREYLREKSGNINYKCIGVVVHRYQVIREVYGADQTDAGLVMIGKYLESLFFESKVFYCRKGRFVILADPKTDVEGICEIIFKRFEKPWKSDKVELYLTAGFVSLDFSGFQECDDELLTTLAKTLDKAGNSESGEIFYISDDDIEKTRNEIRIRRYVENAIDNNSIELFLQPLVDKNGKIVGAEALSRIRDSEGNLISPGLFIPLVENSGRINEMGEQIFEKTCAFMCRIKDNGLSIEWINVNLSPIQFTRTDLADKCAEIVKEYQVDPGLIHLEITEGSVIDDSFMTRQINALVDKGFKFVLDDYGTGYSNLSRLKKVPFINIKLDKSLVWNYDKKPDAILPNMVSTFKYMGFGITAEGIETGKMASEMIGIGCDYLQGYYYSEPIPENDFFEMLSQR